MRRRITINFTALGLPHVSGRTPLALAVLTGEIGGQAIPNFMPHVIIGRTFNANALNGRNFEGKTLDLRISEMILEEMQDDESSKILCVSKLFNDE